MIVTLFVWQINLNNYILILIKEKNIVVRKYNILLSLLSIIFSLIIFTGCFVFNNWNMSDSSYVEIQEYWNKQTVNSKYDSYYISVNKEINNNLDLSMQALIVKKENNYEAKLAAVFYEGYNISERYEIYVKEGFAYIMEHELASEATKVKIDVSSYDYFKTATAPQVSKYEQAFVTLLEIISVFEDVIEYTDINRIEYEQGTEKYEEVNKAYKDDMTKFEINFEYEIDDESNEYEIIVNYKNDKINSHYIKDIVSSGEEETVYEVEVYTYYEAISFPDLTEYE